jgi:hypothetical protein
MRHLMLLAIALALTLSACGGSMPPPTGDGGMSDGGGDGGLLPFGSPCAANSECASNICFIGGNRTFCSLHCTMATAATDCPVPPTSGTCNMQGYCKP